ncbi:MAG: GNAT family N-acetyltransferase, partial [Asticcacaulis sp.]|nr:GNAT family N-acetyltransferase [Asticcacaulis sp.]
MTEIRQLNAPCTQLEQIHARCFDYGWTATDFADLLIKPHHRTYVFEADGDVVSFVVVAVVDGEGEILTIATDPDYQHRGLARALLDQVIAALGKEGAASLFLEVATDNVAALRLY